MIGYSDFGVEPDGFVLLDSGSLFEFSGESFKSNFFEFYFRISSWNYAAKS
jgi:hypothetical protein